MRKIFTATIFVLGLQIIAGVSVFADNALETEALDTLNVAISNNPYSLDPHLGTYHTEAQIQTGLYEGLFTYGSDATEPQPALASSFKVSRDKLRWTFTIRENAKWSDGTKITASDVRESWLRLLENKDAQYSSMLDVVSGAKALREGTGNRDDVAITAPNDTTLTVRLVEPTGHFAHLLCHNSMSAVKADLSIYSGPFILTEKNSKQIVLTKNSNYWDAENIKLEKINIHIEDDDEETAHLFNTGAIDWIIENANVGKIINRTSVQVSAEFATLYLFFKNRGSIFDNPAIRNALLEAVPWEQLRSGFIIPATTLIYPISGYPQVNGFTYTDSAEALELMRDARREAKIPLDEKFKLTVAIGEHMEYMRTIVELLNDAWQPLGVEVAPLNVRGDYFSAISVVDADIFMYNWIGDFGDPIAFLELFRGNSTLNMTGWQNADFDKLLSESAYAEGIERYKILAQAEQILIDSGEIMPISHMVSVNVLDLNSINGWTQNAINVHPFKFISKNKTTKKIPGVI